MTGKQLKALFGNLADDAQVDIWLEDGTGGGVAIGDLVSQPEMSTSAGFAVVFPAGYYLTTFNPEGPFPANSWAALAAQILRLPFAEQQKQQSVVPPVGCPHAAAVPALGLVEFGGNWMLSTGKPPK